MRLSDLRNYVRTQTQTIESELPDSTIDLYLQEAFNRTVAYENQWPSYEKTWELTQIAGSPTIDQPGDINVPAITGLYKVRPGTNRTDYRLDLAAHNVCTELYGSASVASTRYFRFSVWADKLFLWPQTEPEANVQWRMTGFRRPIDWIAAGPTSVPDCDERLHQAFAHYAVALAYAQQEDVELENDYMGRWVRDVEMARGAIMEPSQDRPLIMGPQRWSRIQPYSQRPFAYVDTTGL